MFFEKKQRRKAAMKAAVGISQAAEFIYQKDPNRRKEDVIYDAIRSFDNFTNKLELESLIDFMFSLSIFRVSLETAITTWLTHHKFLPKLDDDKFLKALKSGKTNKQMKFRDEIDELIRKTIIENAPSIHEEGWGINDPLKPFG